MVATCGIFSWLSRQPTLIKRFLIFGLPLIAITYLLIQILNLSSETEANPKNDVNLNNFYGKFLHITDIHVDVNYIKDGSLDSLCHRKEKGIRTNAGKYGALGSDCDSPVDLVTETYNFLKHEFSDKIDFIIDTGDVVRHNRDELLPRTDDNVIEDHSRVVDYYNKYLDLNKIRIIPTIGNNDEFKQNSFKQGSRILKELAKLWKIYQLDLTNDSSFLSGGYFKVDLLNRNLKVISLNTLAWFRKNKKIIDCDEPGVAKDQMLWLESELNKSRLAHSKVYIIGHVPPHKVSGKKLYVKKCYADYIDLIGDYNDVILAQFHGHTNADTLSVLVKETPNFKNLKKHKKAKKYSLISLTEDRPALTLHPKNIIGVLTNGPSIIPVNNPALRVYTYSPSNHGNLLEYTQYYADLAKANKEGKLHFEVEYSSKSSYGLHDLSVESWKEFVPRLLKSQKLYNTYANFISVSNNNPSLDDNDD